MLNVDTEQKEQYRKSEHKKTLTLYKETFRYIMDPDLTEKTYNVYTLKMEQKHHRSEQRTQKER